MNITKSPLLPTTQLSFDTKVIPFSRRGSYLTFSDFENSPLWKNRPEPAGFYLRTVHGGKRKDVVNEVFKLDLVFDGKLVSSTIQATPSCLSMSSPRGQADICFARTDVVRFRVRGDALRLQMDTTTSMGNMIVPLGDGVWSILHWASSTKYLLTMLSGALHVDAPWDEHHSRYMKLTATPTKDDNVCEFSIQEYLTCACRPAVVTESFDESVSAVSAEFSQWCISSIAVPAKFEQTGNLAMYLLWSAHVNPSGHFKRTAVLSSKNWMSNVWNWDNCFDAIALARIDPQQALNQLLLFFDHQDPLGGLPSSLNDRNIRTVFTIAPIQGWTIRYLRRIAPEFFDKSDVVHLLYEPLARYTRFWFEFQDVDHDGIPQFNHGFDSGWDNASVFDVSPMAETPELSAYLIIQLDTLSDLARSIGRHEDAADWKAQADALLIRFIKHFSERGTFVAKTSGDHRTIETECLVRFMPIVLGRRLPPDTLTMLLRELLIPGRFLTPHGFATESPRSPYYQSDGYWRGPIWPSTTLLLVEGLLDVGETDLALHVAERFCEMVVKSGFSENFDALTGQGLRDGAYTWAASVFLILSQKLPK